MKCINFIGSENLKTLRSILSLVIHLDFFEDEYGYYAIIEDDEFKTLQLVCNEENIKFMVSHNRDSLCYLMLNYCNYAASDFYHISDLVLLQLMANNQDIKQCLIKLFSRVDPHLIHTAKAYLYNSLNSIKTAKDIFIHRNTFNYRIQQFIDQCGVDIRDYKNSLLFNYYLQLKQ